MTQATSLKYSQFAILIGDGATPTENFAAVCGLTSRSFNRTAQTNQTNVPDCDNEDEPSWLETDVVSLGWSVSGEGVLAEEAKADWDSFFGQQKNIQIHVGNDIFEGAAILTGLQESGSRGNKVEVSIEITGTGELVKTTG